MDKSLSVIEQKTVEFYDDEVIAVRLDNGEVLVPIRPICENMGLSWSAQYERINRDPVLVDFSASVRVTRTEGAPRDLLCLPLKYLPGWLFGVSANRVKPELRERVVRYQRECYDVLAEAFTEGRLTADPVFDDLLLSDSDAVQAYKMLQALVKLARNQILLESQLQSHSAQLVDHDLRLENIEATLGDTDRYVTPDQASQISQAVKAVAITLGKKSSRNEFGGVYGELYRKFGITGYKQLPAAKFQEAMDWLNEWREHVEGDLPF